jgi:hypothetical protein
LKLDLAVFQLRRCPARSNIEKVKPCLFRLLWGQFASAKRAGIKARSCCTAYLQGHSFPPHRDLGANGAARAVPDRIMT